MDALMDTKMVPQRLILGDPKKKPAHQGPLNIDPFF